jgi:hypothetical protein
MTSEELDAAVADAVAKCEGDLLATVRMLVVAVDFWQGLAAKLADAVSPGFVRGDPAFTVPDLSKTEITLALDPATPDRPGRFVVSQGRRPAHKQSPGQYD